MAIQRLWVLLDNESVQTAPTPSEDLGDPTASTSLSTPTPTTAPHQFEYPIEGGGQQPFTVSMTVSTTSCAVTQTGVTEWEFQVDQGCLEFSFEVLEAQFGADVAEILRQVPRLALVGTCEECPADFSGRVGFGLRIARVASIDLALSLEADARSRAEAGDVLIANAPWRFVANAVEAPALALTVWGIPGTAGGASPFEFDLLALLPLSDPELSASESILQTLVCRDADSSSFNCRE